MTAECEIDLFHKIVSRYAAKCDFGIRFQSTAEVIHTPHVRQAPVDLTGILSKCQDTRYMFKFDR